MPEIDIHLRLASLEADVIAIRSFILQMAGPGVLPPSRIDHPANSVPVASTVVPMTDAPTPPPETQPGPVG